MALTKKQQELRAQGIGASEIGVLAGLSRWSTPIAIWEAKVRGQTQEETLAMKLGTEFEEPIARIYARDRDRFVAKVDTIVSAKYPFAVASCDRAVFLKREDFGKDPRAKCGLEDLKRAEKLLELKSTTWRMAYEWGQPETDQVPEYFLAQCVWQMGVTELTAPMDLSVLFDKDRLPNYRIPFSAELFAGLYEIGARFMIEHVETKIPPPPDSSEKYKEFLDRQFPQQKTESLLTATEKQEAAVMLYAKLKIAQKRIDTHLKLASNLIKVAIGEHTGLVSPRFGQMTWKKTKDTTTFNHVAAFVDMQTLCSLLISRLPEGDERAALQKRLLEIPKTHERVKPGFRRFHSKWSNEAKLDIAKVQIMFDDLEAATLGEVAEEKEEAAAEAAGQSNPWEE